MAFLFGQGGTGSTISIYRGLNSQSSCQGAGITVGWGRVRIAGNMIWYGDFQQHAEQQGGKGGGSGTSYDYSASFLIGLCHGPGAKVREIWDGQTIISLVVDASDGTPKGGQPQSGSPQGPFPWGGGGTVFAGDYQQAAWGYMETAHPTQALGYNYLCYAALENYNLGGGAEVPSLTFLIDCPIQDAPDGQNAKIYSVLEDALTNPIYGLGFPAARLDACAAAVSYWDCLSFWVSPFAQDQTPANDLLSKLIEYTNCEFVQRGGKLSVVPYGDTALSANGATYTPPTPVANFTDDDFILPGKGKDPIVCTRKEESDVYNVTRIEYLDSNLCVATYEVEEEGVWETEQVGTPFPPTIAYAYNQAEIETFGERQESVQSAHFITNAAMAQQAAQLRLQRIAHRNTYKLTVGFKGIQYDLMDIVTLSELQTGMSEQWVRIKEIAENENGEFEFTVEDYLPDAGRAEVYQTSANSTSPNPTVASPGSVSAPVIFEPPLALSGELNSLWIAVAGASANWGGCVVWASTDGSHYEQIGTVAAPSRYGVTTADCPAHTDPDTADTLSVNLALSRGVLNGGAQADADNHNLLALVGAEVISFSACTLTSANNYNLGTYIRRGQCNTEILDHPTGTSFVRLDDNVYKGAVQVQNIGKQMYFKFTSFNLWGQALESLANVTAYTYTPHGTCDAEAEFPNAIADPAGNVYIAPTH
jgi:hypothetical protein